VLTSVALVRRRTFGLGEQTTDGLISTILAQHRVSLTRASNSWIENEKPCILVPKIFWPTMSQLDPRKQQPDRK
jgi:hypothetical protein